MATATMMNVPPTHLLVAARVHSLDSMSMVDSKGPAVVFELVVPVVQVSGAVSVLDSAAVSAVDRPVSPTEVSSNTPDRIQSLTTRLSPSPNVKEEVHSPSYYQTVRGVFSMAIRAIRRQKT